MTSSLYWSTYLFIKNRMIFEYKVTLLVLYFQCSFCDKLQLKESIFFLFLKTGFKPDEIVSVTKIGQKYSRVKTSLSNVLSP